MLSKLQWEEHLLPLLVPRVRNAIRGLPHRDRQQVEEIRLRSGSHPLLDMGDRSCPLPLPEGVLTLTDIQETVNLLSQYSFYAYAGQLAQGYLTVAGGHRIGVAGRVVAENNLVTAMAEIASLNFRVARQLPGVADTALPWLFTSRGQVCSTLILAPPRCGKTTLLRDLVRQLSAGGQGRAGLNVGLVDERSELAGCYRGVPQLDVGPRTDVLDACPKEQGLLMLVRSMGPQVVAADELGRSGDMAAIESALCAGVAVLCTAHANDLKDAENKPVLGKLLAQGFFERILVLARHNGKPRLAAVIALPDRQFLYRSD
ncbi:MAG: stage III sporulation protein AA [Firmicutes bacterium]|nr:stage III sporulation protein AA [Bacillota bacterium]